MANIVQHSKKVLWIHGGQVQAYGDPEEVVDQYLKLMHEQVVAPEGQMNRRNGLSGEDSLIQIANVSLCDKSGKPRASFEFGDAACIDITYTVTQSVADPVIGVSIQDIHGLPLGGVTTRLDGFKVDTSMGTGTLRLVLHPLLFVKGAYTIHVHVSDHLIQHYYDFKSNAALLIVNGPSIATREISGYVNYPHTWEFRE
jgi:hypothetical protein